VFSFPRSAPRGSKSFSGFFRAFTIDGEAFAVPGESVEPGSDEPGRIHPLPTAPPHVQGVVFKDNAVRAVIDLARHMGKKGFSERSHMLLAKSGGLAFLVDEDMGRLKGKVLHTPMPRIAASDFIDHALVWKGKVMPLLDVHASVSQNPSKAFSKKYSPRSRFQNSFGKKEAILYEFALNGLRQSVPKSQVEDVVGAKPWRKLRGVHPLMSGVVEHEGEALPVLDLSVCFGKRTEVGQDTKMMLIKNGNFRAMVLAETVIGRRTLAISEQRTLPIKQSHPYVYGCYTHDNSVQLILNVEALTSHFDEKLVSEYFDMFSKKSESTEILADGSEPVHKTATAVPVSGDHSAGAEADATETVDSYREIKGYEALAESTDKEVSDSVTSPEVEDRGEEPVMKDAGAEAGADATETVASYGETERAKQPSEDQDDASPKQTASDKTVADSSPETFVSQDEQFGEEEQEEEKAPPLSGEHLVSSSKSKKSTAVKYAAPVLTLLFVIFVFTYLVEQGTKRADEETASLVNAQKAQEETVLTGEGVAPHGEEGVALSQKSGEEISLPDKKPGSKSEETPTEPAKSVKTEQPKPARESRGTLLIEIGPEESEIAMSTVDTSPQDAELYEVQRGDTLWHLAQRFTGDPFKYHRIAKDSDIKNPDLIFPGQKVFIKYKGRSVKSSEHLD
jgi:chemotaxis signal transduction protein/nucleoid-associated protein YgaU